MKNSEITDPLFLQAVEAIDSGNTQVLDQLITHHPELIKNRLDYPAPGYFQHPYLIWFVADNPIRNFKLPANIIDVTKLLTRAVQQYAKETFQLQIDYTLGLVATGRIPRECGVQIEMIDLLIDAGAKTGSVMGALAHNNIDAANHLIERGATLNLAGAVCLERENDIDRLAKEASEEEKQLALTAAAFYGKSAMISYLLKLGADPNAYLKNSYGFHAHATALHQAVSSGSLESVKILLDAGADPELKDKIYEGTMLDWASHLQARDGTDENAKKRFAAIETFLLEKKNEK